VELWYFHNTRMMPAQSRLDAGFWSVPGHAPVIEYARPVLNGILTHVMDAFESYLSGGYEVGGVLFGTRTGSQVRVRGFRRLDIQPPRPSFVLSEGDQERLSELLDKARLDQQLIGLEPVGWYHSHTRSEIFLSEPDLEIYDRFFPESWQVAMVLRPAENEPVRIGFFFREPDGFIRTDQSYQEFAVDPPVRSDEYRPRPPWELGEDGKPEEVIEALPAVPPSPQANLRAPRAGLWKLTRGFLAALALLAVIAAGLLSIIWLRQPEPPMAIEIIPAGGRLVIQWNPHSLKLTNANEVMLRIQDGKQRSEVKLDPGKLARSRYHYTPVSPRVDVLLEAKLAFGRTRREGASYLAHPDWGRPARQLVEARNEESEARSQVLALQQELLSRRQESAALESSGEELARRYDELLAAKTAPPKRAAPKTLAFRTAPPKPSPPRDLPAAPEITPRAGAIGSTLPQTEIRLRPPEESPRPVLVAAARIPASPPVAAPAQPRSPAPVTGKLIWTGDLGRNAVLTIAGKKPSSGFLIGELPGGPVQVGAYPAELSPDGLRVLTSNPKLATEPRVEAASAANGWNKTHYIYDPRAVRDVIVEQRPEPANPTRVVLRAGSRKLSVVVIEWRLVEP